MSEKSERLVVIASFDNLSEAELAKARLESGGIQSFLRDDYILRVYPLISKATGGVKLEVREEDAQAAYQILARDKPAIDALHNQADQAWTEPVCPRCGSPDIQYLQYWRSSLLGLVIRQLIGFLPLRFRKKRWKCYKCRYEWK